MKIYFIQLKCQKKKNQFYIKICFLKLYYQLKLKKFIENATNSITIKFLKKKSLIDSSKKKNYKIKIVVFQKNIYDLFMLLLNVSKDRKNLNRIFFYSDVNLGYDLYSKNKSSKIKKIKRLIIDQQLTLKKKNKYIKRIKLVQKKTKKNFIFNIKDLLGREKTSSIFNYKNNFYKKIDHITMQNFHFIHNKYKKIMEIQIKYNVYYKFIFFQRLYSFSKYKYMSLNYINFYLKNWFIFYAKLLKNFFINKILFFSPDSLIIKNKYFFVNGIKYLKICLIGKGGSCKVYKIIDQNRKLFALKKTKIFNFGNGTLHSCINEISILKILKNRNKIIQLKNADISLSDGILYLVFEYGESDLEDFIKKNINCFSKIKLIRVLWKQMLESVHTLHEERIVHGDIKPSNFLLINNALKIIDFGISKPIQKNTTNITRDIPIGTLNYMSPEAIMYIPHLGYNYKKMKISRSSDIWSLGCILFQMVYGNSPLYHLPMMKKIQAIICKKFEILILPINISNLKDVLKNCLIKNPNLRPSIPELILHPFLFKQNTSIQNLINFK